MTTLRPRRRYSGVGRRRPAFSWPATTSRCAGLVAEGVLSGGDDRVVGAGALTVEMTRRIPLAELPAVDAETDAGRISGKVIVFP